MAFFDNLGKRVSEVGAKAIQKTKELSDTTKLNVMISDEERKISDVYSQIGKLYVSVHREDYEEIFAPMMACIMKSERKVNDYRKQIQEIKMVDVCMKCSAEVARGATFCSTCGSELITTQKYMETNEKRCMGCGALIQSSMRFCTSCGRPVPVTLDLDEQNYKEDVSTARLSHGNQMNDADELLSAQSLTEEGIKCQNCGSYMGSGLSFCTECGKKL